AEAMVDIDTTGAEALHQVLKLLASRGVTFALARANLQLPSLLQRYHLLELIGENRLYPTNRHAVVALCPERSHIVSEEDSPADNADNERDLS
ncbi:MAG: STAS domain-containing protein, partial [Planctomycetes bacterium]|nr:STAS domain-containing protein [Planctomycetota bacterium]